MFTNFGFALIFTNFGFVFNFFPLPTILQGCQSAVFMHVNYLPTLSMITIYLACIKTHNTVWLAVMRMNP